MMEDSNLKSQCSLSASESDEEMEKEKRSSYSEDSSDIEDEKTAKKATKNDGTIKRPNPWMNRITRRRVEKNEMITDFAVIKAFDKTIVGEKMAELLGKVGALECAGACAVSEGIKDAPFTYIKLKDGTSVTVLRFPVLEEDLERLSLVPKFEQVSSPVSARGRGQKKIVDVNESNSWQLDPRDFEISNKDWDTFISNSIVPKIAERFAIKDSFVAQKSKLILCQTGYFFKPDSDSKKEDGTFGTLILQLPSKYTGGEFIIRHDGCTKILNHSTKDGSEEFLTYYTAFYGDCEQEMRPILSGVRVCIVHNLVLTNNSKSYTPSAELVSKTKKEFGNILHEWRTFSKDDDDESEAEDPMERYYSDNPIPRRHHTSRLVYLLENKYSSKKLSHENMKGSDKAVANFLMDMADEHDLIAFFGIMKRSSITDGESFVYETDENTDVTVKHPRTFLMDKDFASMLSQSPAISDPFSCQDVDIIPKKRLEALKPYCEKQELWFQEDRRPPVRYNCYTGEFHVNDYYRDDSGLDVSMKYRSACILIFPSENIFLNCRKNLPDSVAQEMFLMKLQKYKTKKEEVLISAFAKAFVERQAGCANSSMDLMNLLEELVEIGAKNALSQFMKSYWKIIGANLGSYLSAIRDHKGMPSWDYLFEELKKQINRTISSQQYSRELFSWELEVKMNATRMPSEFVAAFQFMMDLNDKSLVSTFLQTHGESVLFQADDLLPVVIATKDILGEDFIRAEIVRMLDNSKISNTASNTTWDASLDAIGSINDADNQLLSKFLLTLTSPIRHHIDTFIPAILLRKEKLGDQYVMDELIRIFPRSRCDQIYRLPAKKLSTALHILIKLKDVELVKKFIAGYLEALANVSLEVLPAILAMEDAFGWTIVVDQLNEILNWDSCDKDYFQWVGLMKDLLEISVEKNDAEKDQVNQICYENVKVILHRLTLPSHMPRYHNLSDFKIRELLKEIAKIELPIELNIIEFLQTKNSAYVIDLFKFLASGNKDKLNLDERWSDILKHWYLKIHTAATTPIIEPEWRIRSDFRFCSRRNCYQCANIRDFMLDPNRIQERFLGGRDQWDGRYGHRQHVLSFGDLTVTEKRNYGRGPNFAWIITKKENASYLKQLEEKKQGEKDLAELDNLLTACNININEIV